MIDLARIADAQRRAAARAADAVDLAAQLSQIPAPTGDEAARAVALEGILQQRGFSTERSESETVYVRIGPTDVPALMLAAHTDTVFPATTDLSLTWSEARVAAPGVGDNCLGVAATVIALEELAGLPEVPAIIAAFTVGEEGLGNLRGAREAVDRHVNDLHGFVAVEGHNLGRVTHVGVGSVRWRVNVTGPGGHSWGAFGKPSAIHALGSIVHAIGNLDVPSNPRTTYNVGLISGGTSVNTIAASASAVIDMRSIDADALQQLAERVRTIIEAQAGTEISVSIDVLGERAAGATPPDAALVTTACQALSGLGLEPILDASSTDANAAIGRQVPAICIGITRGGGGHTVQEYIERSPVATGLAQLLLIARHAGTDAAAQAASGAE